MSTRYFGQRIKRNEDFRMLTGQALHVDDIDLPDMLHVAFYRSRDAHGIIKSIDVAAAKARAGVVAVYTAADLGDYWQPGPLLVPPPPTIKRKTFYQRTQVPLAKDKVRLVGEPIVMIVAES
nr:xanthine dehydrogenase family protein molybdopterin-binding subunit [Anaerolineae bacterium]